MFKLYSKTIESMSVEITIIVGDLENLQVELLMLKVMTDMKVHWGFINIFKWLGQIFKTTLIISISERG